jgi:hypothetical protein
LKPEFSEDGSNDRKFEGEVYSMFLKYLSRLLFGTLVQFIQSVCFLPTANTCINRMNLTRGSIENPLPSADVLFNLYDYAFANSYFGLI